MYLSIMTFLKMSVPLSGNNSSSFLDLIILILLLGRFVLMKEIPKEHFLSYNCGKTLYTASCTESWRKLINEYVFFSLHHSQLKFGFLFPLQPILTILTLLFQTLKNKLSCKLVP